MSALSYTALTPAKKRKVKEVIFYNNIIQFIYDLGERVVREKGEVKSKKMCHENMPQARIYSWRKIQYGRTKTKGNKPDLLTVIELFHSSQALLYFVNRNS